MYVKGHNPFLAKIGDCCLPQVIAISLSPLVRQIGLYRAIQLGMHDEIIAFRCIRAGKLGLSIWYSCDMKLPVSEGLFLVFLCQGVSKMDFTIMRKCKMVFLTKKWIWHKSTDLEILWLKVLIDIVSDVCWTFMLCSWKLSFATENFFEKTLIQPCYQDHRGPINLSRKSSYPAWHA